MTHPRDRLLTLYGRKPVLEVLEDRTLPVERILLARNADGPIVAAILNAARARNLTVVRVTPEEVTRISRNGRQDQGAVIDVIAPRMAALEGVTSIRRQNDHRQHKYEKGRKGYCPAAESRASGCRS